MEGPVQQIFAGRELAHAGCVRSQERLPLIRQARFLEFSEPEDPHAGCVRSQEGLRWSRLARRGKCEAEA
jgi:hypothetical protein